MIRKYFHYKDLEEYQSGMWKIINSNKRLVNAEKAAALMRDPVAFGAAMGRVIREWPNSCMHNLTAENINHLAWLGHAGCCIAVGSPEENTRIGWHKLTPREQDIANDTAQTALNEWRRNNLDQMEMF